MHAGADVFGPIHDEAAGVALEVGWIVPLNWRQNTAAYLYRQLDGLNLQIPQALSYGEEGWIEPSALARFATPTLFITSEQDTILPPPVIREVADLIKGAEFVVLPSAGHSAYFETPQQFNAAVAQFLARYAG